jgi:hypothetical protein
MIETIIYLDNERRRFERHHKKIAISGFDYTWEENGFVDNELTSAFAGWMLAVQAQREDEVELYFDHTYGWKFVSALNRTEISSPVFQTYTDQDLAINWARESGLILMDIKD